MGIPEDKKPTSEMHPRRGRSRSGLRLGRKSVRLLSAIVVLVLILTVALILFGHLASIEEPHITP